VLAFLDIINRMKMPGDEAATELAAMVSEYFSLNSARFLVCEELRCHLRTALRRPGPASNSSFLRG
jgi:hypothetical protein